MRVATGRSVVPRLVKSIDGIEVPVVDALPLGMPTSQLDSVRAGMMQVVNGQHGTLFGIDLTERTFARIRVASMAS